MKELETRPRGIRVETRGEAVVVRPEGPCDKECTEALEGLMKDIEGGTKKNVILDASRLKYIDTPGFRWIVDGFQRLQGLGGSLIVVGLAGPAERAFRLLQLDRFIPAAKSIEAALERIRRPGGSNVP